MLLKNELLCSRNKYELCYASVVNYVQVFYEYVSSLKYIHTSIPMLFYVVICYIYWIIYAN